MLLSLRSLWEYIAASVKILPGAVGVTLIDYATCDATLVDVGTIDLSLSE